MRKLWCLEVEKIGEKTLDGISKLFFLKTNGGRWRDLKGKRRGAFLSNKIRPHQPSPRVGRVCHTGTEGWLGRVAHGLHTWWQGHGLWPSCFSRAPLTFFSRIRASELRFWICFRITNCDFLTHDDDDSETLTNGWEFISENDEGHNSTNENEN